VNAETLKIGDQQSVDLQDCVLLGKLVGIWGVKGWLKVFSYTRPRQDIGIYKRWLLVPASPSTKKHPKRNVAKTTNVMANSVSVRKCRQQGQHIIAHIEGVDYRDQAEGMFGYEVYIEKNQLKPLVKGEFYWSDMIGCEVTNKEGDKLGVVNSMLETGANDVLVVHGSQENLMQNSESSLEGYDEEKRQKNEIIEHLIPYSDEIVLSVDTEGKAILVDWGMDYLVTEKSTEPKKPKLTKQERAEEIRLAKLAKAESLTDGSSNGPGSA
jgi:16S rRNA processing protein RimM